MGIANVGSWRPNRRAEVSSALSKFETAAARSRDYGEGIRSSSNLDNILNSVIVRQTIDASMQCGDKTFNE